MLKMMMRSTFADNTFFHFFIFISFISFIPFISNFEASAQPLTLVELNCENLFDCKHDTLKQDDDWTPASVRHWTPPRYWHKLNGIAQVIISSTVSDGDPRLPDLVALVEVENDSVLHQLTRRSLLRNAGYQYLMTESPDVRGIDVALLYQPFTFRPLCYDMLRVIPLPSMRPTRDILYVQGETLRGDTLHVFVVHAPSRFGGERPTRPNRRLVADRLLHAVDSIRGLAPDAHIVVAGDFNDDADAPALRYLEEHGLSNLSRHAKGTHGAKGTYRYQGRWQSIDHVLATASLAAKADTVFVNDAPFLLEEDKKYGGVKPLRTYNGYRYQHGFSDHLPLVVRFKLP